MGKRSLLVISKLLAIRTHPDIHIHRIEATMEPLGVAVCEDGSAPQRLPLTVIHIHEVNIGAQLRGNPEGRIVWQSFMIRTVVAATEQRLITRACDGGY